LSLIFLIPYPSLEHNNPYIWVIFEVISPQEEIGMDNVSAKELFHPAKRFIPDGVRLLQALRYASGRPGIKCRLKQKTVEK